MRTPGQILLLLVFFWSMILMGIGLAWVTRLTALEKLTRPGSPGQLTRVEGELQWAYSLEGALEYRRRDPPPPGPPTPVSIVGIRFEDDGSFPVAPCPGPSCPQVTRLSLLPSACGGGPVTAFRLIAATLPANARSADSVICQEGGVSTIRNYHMLNLGGYEPF